MLKFVDKSRLKPIGLMCKFILNDLRICGIVEKIIQLLEHYSFMEIPSIIYKECTFEYTEVVIVGKFNEKYN